MSLHLCDVQFNRYDISIYALSIKILQLQKTGVFVESKTCQFNKGGLRCPENLSSVYVGKVDSTAAKIAQLV